ncbi:MAG: RHS repeat-associated core domain-containing protein [Phycisphaerales bacterium]|nr:RHS repeat-associated core domain-containing protein [Phycisphaerales bacterium]
MSEHISGVTGEHHLFGYDYQTQNWEETADTYLKLVYDGWTLDTPGNPAGAGFGQGPAGIARPASQGWNVIMVLDGKASDTIQSRYTWGLDMSGLAGQNPDREGGASGIHGAGGISGLLAVEEISGALAGEYWYLYDGNGNVMQLLDASDRSIAARYEYDPYGNKRDIPANPGAGHYAATNPFRFSTKWFDESGLGYWGYRYYSSRLGRWINRDPIEEEGGINLYVYTKNSPVIEIDPHGQTIWSCLVCGCCGGASAISCAVLCAIDGHWDVPGEGTHACFAKCINAVLGADVVFDVTCVTACVSCGIISAF